MGVVEDISYCFQGVAKLDDKGVRMCVYVETGHMLIPDHDVVVRPFHRRLHLRTYHEAPAWAAVLVSDYLLSLLAPQSFQIGFPVSLEAQFGRLPLRIKYLGTLIW
jgi:hypothetical protein